MDSRPSRWREAYGSRKLQDLSVMIPVGYETPNHRPGGWKRVTPIVTARDAEREAYENGYRDALAVLPSEPPSDPERLDVLTLAPILGEWFDETGIGAWARFDVEDVELLIAKMAALGKTAR